MLIIVFDYCYYYSIFSKILQWKYKQDNSDLIAYMLLDENHFDNILLHVFEKDVKDFKCKKGKGAC